jgi:hypothetical protein
MTTKKGNWKRNGWERSVVCQGLKMFVHCVSSPKRVGIKKDQGICEVPTNLLKFHFAHKNIPKIIFDS